MRILICCSAIATLLATGVRAGDAGLQSENLLTPVPSGFKAGYAHHQGQIQIVEFVPMAETVQDWSRIVTAQIDYGQHDVEPDKLPTLMSKGWTIDCPGGSSRKLVGDVENGYPVSIWMFLCPLNPSTGKPESMWMKVISGSDSLYSVQYAYRSAATREMIPATMAYLRSVKICDTRKADRSCPVTH